MKRLLADHVYEVRIRHTVHEQRITQWQRIYEPQRDMSFQRRTTASWTPSEPSNDEHRILFVQPSRRELPNDKEIAAAPEAISLRRA